MMALGFATAARTESRLSDCYGCAGSGLADEDTFEPCPECDAKGWIRIVQYVHALPDGGRYLTPDMPAPMLLVASVRS